MDKEQEERQFLGFFGIFKESFNIVSSRRKIFGQITLALILPLSFIYLAQIQISNLMFADIRYNQYMLNRAQEGTTSYKNILNMLLSELLAFILFKLAYLIFFIILTLLSTSAVIYTIACIYTSKDISFNKVMSVVPKVWKRVMFTFVWNFMIHFAYNFVAILILAIGSIVGIVFLGLSENDMAIFGSFFAIAYLIGLLYINIIWHLATVVSVLEESYGRNAMAKGKALIKGKMGVCVGIFLVLGGFTLVVHWFFEIPFILRKGDIMGRLGYGMLCLFFLSILLLISLVIQTVLYFICKSYHHENINKSLLSDHLEGYLGEYVPLKTKDVQLEQSQV